MPCSINFKEATHARQHHNNRLIGHTTWFSANNGWDARHEGMAAGGVLAAGDRAAAADRAVPWDEEFDVIVVGSGFAGLAAAAEW